MEGDRPRERFIAGDPLRGLAALGVLAVHAGSSAVNATGYGAMFAAPGGYLGVYGTVPGSLLLGGGAGFLVFFVLSGYLIGGPFVRAAIEGWPMPSLRRFARNRVLRIVPAYWMVLTLLVVLLVWVIGDAAASAAQVADLYAFHVLPDNPLLPWIGQAWTLEVEAKFYVAMPLAALVATPLLRRLGGPQARALAIALPCMAWFVAAPFAYSGPVDGHPFPYYVQLLGAGVGIAALEPLLRPRVAGRAPWARGATAIGVFGVLYMLSAAALGELGAPFDRDLGELFFATTVVAVVVGPLLRQWTGAGCWRVLDNRATRWLGTRSYSFYLVHLALVIELSDLIATADYGYKVTLILLLPAAFAASALAAEMLYRAVERPFLERKRRGLAAPSGTIIRREATSA